MRLESHSALQFVRLEFLLVYFRQTVILEIHHSSMVQSLAGILILNPILIYLTLSLLAPIDSVYPFTRVRPVNIIPAKF